MELTLYRKYPKATYTIGWLMVGSQYFSDTMEDADRGLDQGMPLNVIKALKVYGQTAIPTGRYRIDMDTVSQRLGDRYYAKPYGGILPRLVDVPGFDGILIHPLNTAEDSLGCIGVGVNNQVGRINHSAMTFYDLMDNYLMPAKERGEEIYINILMPGK